MDAASDRYAGDVASAMATVFGSRLVGVYLHGSAVLGGFDARRSDIDVLVVCANSLTVAERSAVAAGLNEERLPCPAHGLELSVVTLPVTRNPTARPRFELHVTTAPDDSKVVDGHEHAGDPDLVLHFAVCQQAGRLAGSGGPASEVFAPVAAELVLAQLARELHWAAEHAAGEYAVLNACRAWRFAVDSTFVSKIDGGRWAMDRVPQPDRELIRTALNRQRCLPAAELSPSAVGQFVHRILARVTSASA
ncbi:MULTISPECIES: aminoglycoside adenylyltransferase domain-containing protein [unclassified Nocardia]|uniref:aminoglycoside adenylyltransferase domain-containing protein n=1 Tax=unclassified Nocardia TaxID=2637762 RepID=UPI001CE4663A|nr:MULTISPECIES: aminoglycoside adenylyltransferase domain-containing protein [unclassified Nocardia]